MALPIPISGGPIPAPASFCPRHSPARTRRGSASSSTPAACSRRPTSVAFIARHGSWNREKKFGYDVIVARPQANGTAKIEPFLTGLLDEAKNEFYGRPTYVFPMSDGSLLVSDETNGATYRISYGQKVAGAPAGKR